MKRLRKCWRAYPVAASIAGLSLFIGCGGTAIDSAKLEDALRHNLETERHEKVASIDCPSGQAVEPKARFTCTVELDGGATETATIEIRDKEADVSVIGLEERSGSGQ